MNSVCEPSRVNLSLSAVKYVTNVEFFNKFKDLLFFHQCSPTARLVALVDFSFHEYLSCINVRVIAMGIVVVVVLQSSFGFRSCFPTQLHLSSSFVY